MSERKAYSRDQLLAVKTKFITLDDDGGGVWVRDVSPREYVDYVEKAKAPDCEKVSDSLLAAKAICDEAGNRLFKDDEYGLIAEKLGVAAQRKIVREILEWHGISKQQLDNAEKN